ncbi:MAG: hypothetical protein JOZ14_11225 [Acidobacteria bacterium]|nr:hypothetical protein [Acidobacteriota bacterium]
MRKILAVCMLVSACLVAQETPIRGPNRDPNPQASTPKVYQGCVIRSQGKILLTGESGAEHNLISSNGRKLQDYVGQEVRIEGNDVNPNDKSSDERSRLSGQPQHQPSTLDVESIEKVADHCSSPK